jgi:hypothetical protein
MKHEPTRHEPNAPSSMTRPTWLAILLVLVLLPASAHAACVRDNPDVLENYDGTIGEGYRVRMTLVFHGAQVEGLYFYASQLRDIALRGTTDGSDLVLDELDAKGTPVARFEAKFVDRDPKWCPARGASSMAARRCPCTSPRKAARPARWTTATVMPGTLWCIAMPSASGTR